MKQKIVFALLMGIFTTGIISFALIALNIGFSDIFFKIWFKSWLLAYLMVIPIILIIGPIIKKLVDRMFSNE
ncbi:DUF2798 domain-containing protein [Flavobacterium commune]|uniref:DUF2798 domain-containing protein n=1 Tax=Flavobacterium commune TaxID=1306519 RepID=A0A1D9PC72_9FLAO|nr:DUF2798 domain-containing protein [Flavobacterium commune]APA00174.1 hypothetical protein BIW12_12455 [Flavobacterium commune]